MPRYASSVSVEWSARSLHDLRQLGLHARLDSDLHRLPHWRMTKTGSPSTRRRGWKTLMMRLRTHSLGPGVAASVGFRYLTAALWMANMMLIPPSSYLAGFPVACGGIADIGYLAGGWSRDVALCGHVAPGPILAGTGQAFRAPKPCQVPVSLS